MKIAIIVVFALLTVLPLFSPKDIDSKAEEASTLNSMAEIKAQQMELQASLDTKTAEFTKGLDDEGNVLFSKSALAWHVYAQRHCAVEADMYRGGTDETVDLRTIIEENCYNKALAERVGEVETLIRSYESP